MRFSKNIRSINAYVFLGIILPLALVTVSTMIASVIAYRHNMMELVRKRHVEMAQLAAANLGSSIQDYAFMLEDTEAEPGFDGKSVSMLIPSTGKPQQAQAVFTGGIFQVDRNGVLVDRNQWVNFPADPSFYLAVFEQAKTQSATSYSDVTFPASSDRGMVLIAVPLLDDQGIFMGATIGIIDPFTDAFGQSIRELAINEEVEAYLVDRNGIVLGHPHLDQVGEEFSDQAFIDLNDHQEKGASVWKAADGEWFVGSSVAVEGTGWYLILKEPLDVINAPARDYGASVLPFGFLAVALILLFVRAGTLRITAPVQKLVDQMVLVASGEQVKATGLSGIQEIDRLGSALERMSIQLASYRTGLRRYVGAITRAQEEERLRIAHELHDETIQSLLAIARRIELYQAEEEDQNRAKQLDQLHEMVSQSALGVRQISQDLRPMALEDLGLVPAVQMLVRSMHKGEGAIPHASFEVNGSAVLLNPDQELVLYRIAQEALMNIRKHAGATAVWVEIHFASKKVQLVITDDGKGFTLPPSMNELVQEGCLGLMGIQERAWSVGGQVSIETKPGAGTKISVSISI